MIKFSKDVLAEIKDRVSLRSEVGKRVSLKRKGQDYWACCPFHNEKSPSFHVREEKGYYHCFGCGAHGNVFDFIQQTQGMTFPEAVEYLAPIAGVTLEREEVDPVAQKRKEDGLAALERACVYFQRSLVGAPLDYFKGRGLTTEVIKEYRLGYAPDSWHELRDYLMNEGFSVQTLRDTGLCIESDKGKGDYDRFRGRVMFPIMNMKGEVIAFGGRTLDGSEPKYLNSPETKFFYKGRNLYALNKHREAIHKQQKALLVEGYMDAVALAQAGIELAVAPLGTAVTEEQIRLLWRYNEAPVVCLDGDEAGQQAAVRLAYRILPELIPSKTLEFLALPQGEDPDSYVKAKGRDAFYDLLSHTIGLDDVLWHDICKDIDLASGQGRATLESRINERLKPIKDNKVRAHMVSSLKDRMWQSILGKRAKSATNHKVPVRVKAQFSKKDMLLALPLYQPAMLADIAEYLAEIPYEDTDMRLIQSTLLKYFHEGGVESDTLQTYLVKADVDEPANKLVKQLHQEVLEGNTQELWRNLYQEVKQQWLTPQKLKQAKAQADENLSQSWEQMRQLLAEKLASK